MEQPFSHTAEELLAMADADQAMRNRSLQGGDWDSTIDHRNTSHLKELINAMGWPKISVVGKKAAEAAWLLAQHADHDPEFQARCLELMKQLPSDEVTLGNVAYLEDRVRVNGGRPQLYGTQFFGEGDSFGPRPIENPDELGVRRKKVGLQPFSKYQREIEEVHRQHQRAAAAHKKEA